MLSRMAGSKAPDRERISPSLQPLVEQLAALHAADRERVVRAARSLAGEARRHPVKWSNLRDACGVVRLGGDAVDDTQALYDG